MKYLLTLTLLISTPALASVEAFLLGTIFGSSGKPKVVHQDEFSLQVGAIERNLRSYDNYPLTATTAVPVGQEQKYQAYFQNQGYEVQTERGKLIFSFQKVIAAREAARVTWEAERAASAARWEAFWTQHRWKIWALAILAVLVISLSTIMTHPTVFGPIFALLGHLIRRNHQSWKAVRKQLKNPPGKWEILPPNK